MPIAPPGTDPQISRRTDRYRSLRALHDISTLDRVRRCSRHRISGGQGVPVVVNGQTAHFSNLQRCGSIWACPVCSAKIRAERAEQISRAITTHYSEGGRAFLLTLTVRHHRGEQLDKLMPVVSEGWSRLMSGDRWRAQKLAYRVRGWVRSLEVTYGQNGWHPHLHVLVLLNGDENWQDRATRLSSELEQRWIDFCVKAGLDTPLEGVAGDVQMIGAPASAAAYVAKVQDPETAARAIGMEVTRHDLKEGRRKSRTPFQVLRDFRETGDLADLRVWREYETSTFRKRAITWSVGLRTELGIDDRTDEEIAGEEVGGVPICVIPGPMWSELSKLRGGVACILRGAEMSGVVGVVQVLEELGIVGVLEPPPVRPGLE